MAGVSMYPKIYFRGVRTVQVFGGWKSDICHVGRRGNSYVADRTSVCRGKREMRSGII